MSQNLPPIDGPVPPPETTERYPLSHETVGHERVVRKRRAVLWVLAFTVLAGLVAGLIAWRYWPTPPILPSSEQLLRESAWATAKEHVLQQVKAPATARFPTLPPTGKIGDIFDSTVGTVTTPDLGKEAWSVYHSKEKSLKQDEAATLYRQLLDQTNGWNRFVVRGWVDSQNDFGSVLRHHFEVYLIRCGDAWALESIEFTE